MEKPLSEPDARRILTSGKSTVDLVNRSELFAAAFASADLPSTTKWRFVVREPLAGWIQVDVPPALAPWHFHNLFRFLATDPAPPTEAVLTSTGAGDWDYWLTRSKLVSRPDFLGGATGRGKPFQLDVSASHLFDHADTRVPPMPTKLALLTRGVHATLLDPQNPAPEATSFELELPDLPPSAWVIPPPASLADEFDIQRTERKGSLAEIFDWVRGRG